MTLSLILELIQLQLFLVEKLVEKAARRIYYKKPLIASQKRTLDIYYPRMSVGRALGR